MVHNPPGGLPPGLQPPRKCTLTVPGGGNFIERLVSGVGEYKCSHTRGFGLAHQKYCPRGGKFYLNINILSFMMLLYSRVFREWTCTPAEVLSILL